MIAESLSAPDNGSTDWSHLPCSVVEHAPSPMAIIEGETHIVRYANSAFCRLMDKTEDQVVDGLFDDLVSKNDKSLTLLDRVFSTHKATTHTEEEHSRTHPLFWSYAMWPVMAHQRPVGVMMQVIESAQLHEKILAMNEALMMSTVRQHEFTASADAANALLQEEITERKQAEEALHCAQALLMDRAGQLEGLVTERTTELVATNKQLEAFVFSIAHDLRAPLRAMQAFSTLLVDGAIGLDEKGKNYAIHINKSAQFMDAMLIDLLAFSAISQQRVELTSVSLESVLESVLSRLKNDIRDTGACVEATGSWPCVMAHESTLAQVLVNLISNSLKFVAPGVPAKVRLRCNEHAGFIRIWVEDNGIGIALDHQEQIFHLFTRLDGGKYSGTGVGLAIVQKGVERMGGALGVHSIPGKGSQFWFELLKSRSL
jgi:signal transduction histidine kinase